MHENPAYRCDFRSFFDWCEQRGAAALPASPETIVEYIESLVSAKPATIERRMCGIGRVHRALNHPDPTGVDAVRLAVRRALRTRSRLQKQALGLRAALRDQLIAACGPDLRGLRNRALIAVGYDTLCRRSELVALFAEDVTRLDDGSASILIRRSKTDQLGQGRLGYIAPRTLERLDIWLVAAAINQGPLFRAVVGETIASQGLHNAQVVRILKRAAKDAGMSELVIRGISGHSMRVGAALDMVDMASTSYP